MSKVSEGKLPKDCKAAGDSEQCIEINGSLQERGLEDGKSQGIREFL